MKTIEAERDGVTYEIPELWIAANMTARGDSSPAAYVKAVDLWIEQAKLEEDWVRS